MTDAHDLREMAQRSPGERPWGDVTDLLMAFLSAVVLATNPYNRNREKDRQTALARYTEVTESLPADDDRWPTLREMRATLDQSGKN